MTQFAKVFRSGNSQAVRLPKDFRFDVDEVEVPREGDAVILRPRPCRAAWRQWSRERWPSPIVAYELYFGANRSRKIEFNLETLRLLFADLVVLDFDQEDARTAGEIRAALALQGTPIRPCDVLLAGQARARDLVFVTNNLAAFQRVDGLKVEDWMRP